MSSTNSARAVLACGLMVASGFAGLAYQIVWTQQSSGWLGHESAAVLAVVAAFFGGLAVGALLLSPRIERSVHPARWYAGCEMVIGAWGLALLLLMGPAASALLALVGPQPSAVWHWSVAFCGTFFLLLPATAAMGATLPAMERVLAGIQSQFPVMIAEAPAQPGTEPLGRHTIGLLYAANTAGAVLGVLAAGFWLVPDFGLLRTAALCAGLNLLCAVLVMRLRVPLERRTADTSDRSMARNHGRTAELRPSPHVRAALAATGLLGIGYEVLAVRALSQVSENTVYTFALLLAVYLIGTALGAAAYARWLVRVQNDYGNAATVSAVSSQVDASRLRNWLLQALSCSCLLGAVLLANSDSVHSWLLRVLGDTVMGALASEALLATFVFLVPTILMGALFSHLSTSARAAGTSFGDALGINTVGAAVAPMLFGVVLVPWLGLKWALSVIAAGYLSLTTRHAWRAPAQWATAALLLAGIGWTPTLVTITIPDGGRLVSHTEGVMASVSVVEDAAGIATLHINNRQQEGSSATLFADARQALLPVALHPGPKRALFLGVGTGLTASSATLDPKLQVDAVELIPEVIAASSHFSAATSSNADPSRLHLMSADARRFVRTRTGRYDVIVSDNFHPARSGSASLYTAEHFAHVRDRLAPGGLFCQWLPLHQLDLDTLRSVVRTFLAVYPHGAALLATHSLDTPVVGLLAHRDDVEDVDLDQVRARLRDPVLSPRLEQYGIEGDLALLGTFIAGPQALARFASGAPLNTDDRPIVAYRAPWITYASDSSPRDRLIELLHELDIGPHELLSAQSAAANSAWLSRLDAYRQARDTFIEAGRNVRPTRDVREMLAQVRDPLLSVLHISPDFRPAYDPLLRMAAVLDETDHEAARALLAQLQQLKSQSQDRRRR